MKRLTLAIVCLLPTLATAEEKTLSTVEVTAGTDDVAERRQSATQKIVINRQDIDNMGALTINDVMGKLPGVDVGTPSADGNVAMRARGMARDSVQMFIDGEKMPPGHGRMIMSTVGRLPASELRQVEIVRGASAEFGSAPVSVNLVLDKPLSRTSTDVKIAFGARGNDPLFQTNVTRSGGDKAFTWALPVTVNHNELPTDRRLDRADVTGVRQNDHSRGDSRTDSFVFSPRLVWKAERDNLTLMPVFQRFFGRGRSDFVRNDQAIPANGYARNDDDSFRRAYDRLRATAEIFRHDIKYSGRLMLSNGEQSGWTRRLNQATQALAQDETRRSVSDLNAALRADWSAGAHTLAANLEHAGHRSEESLTSTGFAYESHRSRDRHWTAWLQDEWSLAAATTLTLGLRGEFLDYAVDGLEQAHRRWMPSLALRWEPAEHWIARGSVGTGIKPPRLDELTNQPVRSVNANTPLEPDQRGNPALRPERSLNFEAAVERYLPGDAGVFGVNAYLRRTDDFIERRVQLEGARWVDRPYNEGTARHWGLEFDGKLRTDGFGWRGATLRSHLTLPRGRVADARLGFDRAARETPRFILSAGFDQTLATASFGGSLQHSGRVRTQTPGEQDYETRARTVLNVYVLQKLDARWNLRLSADNLLRADTRRRQDAFAAGNQWWSLATTEKGARTLLLSLEGKW